MSKQFSKKEVKFMFKHLDELCNNEILLHKNVYFVDSNRENGNKNPKKLYEEQKAFLEGINYVKKYVIKQYYEAIVKYIEDDEFICENALENFEMEK